MRSVRFDGRVAVITGAGRGMGRAHALLLAERGAQVVVNDLGRTMSGSGRSDEPARSVVAEIRARGGVAIANADDISTESGAKALIGCCVETFGRIDAVVHNAGTATFVPFGELTYKHFREIAAVHADGAFLLAHAAWPHMVKQRYGRLLMITSQAALTGVAGLAHYAVGKWGSTGLCRILALEGAAFNIHANALGVCALTRMMESRCRHPETGMADEDAREWWKRYVTPEIISPVVAWLIHEECSLTGEILETSAGHISRQVLAMTDGYTDVKLTLERVRDNFARILDTDHGLHTFPNPKQEKPTSWMHAKVAASLAEVAREEASLPKDG